MKRFVMFAAVGALVALLGAVQDAREPPTPGAQGRATHQKGHPLERLITAGQTDLVVQKDQSPPNVMQPPPGTKPLEWAAKQFPLVLVIRVESVVPKLMSDGDWIQSSVHATVEQTIKSASMTISPGQALKFTQDGGETVIRGTRVRAVLPYAELFEARQRYLVFVDPTDEIDTVLVEPLLSFLVAGPESRLLPLGHEGSAASERGVTLAAALARIKTTLTRTP